MSPLVEVSHAVRARRRDMGLTQAAVATLSGLSRATVNQLEAGTIRDLSLGRASRLLDALGLSIQVSSDRLARGGQGRAKSPPLELAARTASVSYRYGMTAVELREALLTGRFPDAILPHVGTMLDEAPLSLLAKVVEQLHAEEGRDRADTWKTLREWARQLKSPRKVWLA